jgi:hypothetical protein
MRPLDNARAALREAAETIDGIMQIVGVDCGERALARRLRGLARRMNTINVGPGVSICPFRIRNRACWLGQRCQGPEDATCPLSRGPVVVRKAAVRGRKQCSRS